MFLKLSQKAFSLVELMVVIAIVGVVTAVSLNSVSTIQKNNRDAQRLSDLRLIQGALQQYYADANHYPDTLVLTSGAAFTCAAGSCGTTAKTYLNKTPFDPTPGTTTPYCYVPFKSTALTTCAAGQCHYYQLSARLENPSGSTTYTCNSISTYNFQVAPL